MQYLHYFIYLYKICKIYTIRNTQIQKLFIKITVVYLIIVAVLFFCDRSFFRYELLEILFRCLELAEKHFTRVSLVIEIFLVEESFF